MGILLRTAVRAHLDTAALTPSPPVAIAVGGEGRGRGVPTLHVPKLPLSPLVPRGAREKLGAVPALGERDCGEDLFRAGNASLRLRRRGRGRSHQLEVQR